MLLIGKVHRIKSFHQRRRPCERGREKEWRRRRKKATSCHILFFRLRIIPRFSFSYSFVSHLGVHAEKRLEQDRRRSEEDILVYRRHYRVSRSLVLSSVDLNFLSTLPRQQYADLSFWDILSHGRWKRRWSVRSCECATRLRSSSIVFVSSVHSSAMKTTKNFISSSKVKHPHDRRLLIVVDF